MGDLQATVKRLESDAAKVHAAEATAAGLREQLAIVNCTVDMLKGMLKQRDDRLAVSAGSELVEM